MSYQKSKHEYRGYLYSPYLEREPDNQKIWHTVTDGHGKEIGEIPLSPYEYASKETFMAWIDAGMPTREQVNMHCSGNNVCNPSQQDIVNYAFEKVLE